MKKIAVYCSSSDQIDKQYFQQAEQLGQLMASENYALVYGGTQIGLMGAVAKNIKKQAGYSIGITPKKLQIDGIISQQDNHQIITENMSERKQKMIEMADAFIAMPGGFGTLEEVLETMTLKQLGYHNKAIVFINGNKFYKNLLQMFEHFYREKFAKKQYKNIYYIAETPKQAIDYIKNYQVKKLPDKWFL